MAAALAQIILQISGLTDSERVEILANFEIAAEKTFQCEACMATRPPRERTKKGCQGPGKGVAIWRLTVGEKPLYDISTCLGNFWNPGVMHWMQVHQQFKAGILPFEGPLLDQPAKVMDIFDLLGTLENELFEKKQKEAKKKNAKDGGRK